MNAGDLNRIVMSPVLVATLTRASGYADAQSHAEVTLEHMLLALTEDADASNVLNSSGIDTARLAADVSSFLGQIADRRAESSGASARVSQDLRRILEAAASAAQQGRRREIDGAIVLAAIVGDGSSSAAHLLRGQGLTFEAAIRALRSTTQPAAKTAAPAVEQTQPAPQVQVPAQVHRPQASSPAPATSAPKPIEELRRENRDEDNPEILASIRTDSRPSDQGNRTTAAPQWQSSPFPAPSPRTADPAPAPRPAPAQQPVASPVQNAPAQVQPQFRPSPHEPSVAWPATPRPQPAQQQPAPQPMAYPSAQPAPAYPAGGYTPNAAPSGRGPMPGAPPQNPTPYPPQQQAAPRGPMPPHAPMPSVDARGMQRARQQNAGGNVRVSAGQLVENIPRKMRIAIPMVVEARLARAEVKAIAEGLQGGGAVYRHEILVTKAMSVRLRAPDGGFWIETSSPETQWIDNVLGVMADDFASWRWTVTPQQRGSKRLQLVISARTVGADGLAAETALPDQVVEVKVGLNYTKSAKKLAGWAAAAIVGGLFAKFGDALYQPFIGAVMGFVGG